MEGCIMRAFGHDLISQGQNNKREHAYGKEGHSVVNAWHRKNRRDRASWAYAVGHVPRDAWNRFRLEYDVVEDHLNLNGIDLSYRVWVLHGERRLQTSMEHPVVGNMDEINTEEEGLGIGNFVDAYMGHGIEIGDNEPMFVPEPDLGKRYLDYKKKSERKIVSFL
ncbi:hypothetical protein IFM89_000260 [Coptis chinensis]|uniref:Uncharacterized protein n=1 Tax=Coptis chinensis TaxID=261450 RepID=A0A835GTJ1_9MAGN|nr:hypothetical protein IFM89_000260 [Coptis chinensis]